MRNPKIKFNVSDIEQKSILKIVKTLHNEGFECYLIGGSVRDLILGYPVFDFDFATNARPGNIAELFRRVIPTGIKHGTVSIILNRNAYEITTYRADGKYIDGRRPVSVTFSESLEEDVKRRDFTINGLAYDFQNEVIIDHVGGMEDLEAGIIRTIGNPMHRFREDGLRSIRACRFAAKLKFKIEENTFQSIRKTLEISRMVSAERVKDELMKLMIVDKPSIGFEYMRESGLLEIFLPELNKCYGVDQNRFHKYDIYYHSIYTCDAGPADKPIIRLAALLHDIGKEITRCIGDEGDATFYNHEVVGSRVTRKILRRLKFSNEQISRVTNLIVNHMFYYQDEWTDGAVRRFIRKVGLENVNDLFLLRLADRKGTGMREGLPEPIKILKRRMDKIIEEENAFKVTDLEINGNIIIKEFDIEPGPIIGKILNQLLELVLDDPELNRRDILIEKAGKIYKDIE